MSSPLGIERANERAGGIGYFELLSNGAEIGWVSRRDETRENRQFPFV
jgi:hypothetical protein